MTARIPTPVTLPVWCAAAAVVLVPLVLAIGLVWGVAARIRRSK